MTAAETSPLPAPTILGTPECIWDAGANLGEGTMWSPREQALYWIDILTPRLFRFHPASGERRSWRFAEEITAIADAAAELGDFAVLVNNVASDDRHTLESVTPDYYDNRMAINERPALFAIQSVVPGMKRLGAGSIVNLGSTGWQTKGSGYPCYAIAKSSVNGLTRGLAVELGRDRIRINTVSPGWVMTERQVALWLDAEGEQALKRNQCLPDRLMPEDIARMVLFLASDDARMCTAQEFTVDAGWT